MEQGDLDLKPASGHVVRADSAAVLQYDLARQRWPDAEVAVPGGGGEGEEPWLLIFRNTGPIVAYDPLRLTGRTGPDRESDALLGRLACVAEQQIPHLGEAAGVCFDPGRARIDVGLNLQTRELRRGRRYQLFG